MIGVTPEKGKFVPENLGLLQTQLLEATQKLEVAVAESRAASRAENDARNQLNRMQKQFDTAVDEMKRHAPQQTDWATRSGARFVGEPA